MSGLDGGRNAQYAYGKVGLIGEVGKHAQHAMLKWF